MHIGHFDEDALIHIGSTAVSDRRGGPMLDIDAITARAKLQEEPQALECLGFHSRDVRVDSDDKPYVCGSIERNGAVYNVEEGT